MDPNEAIRLSVLAGEIMLSNGSETYRIEDTMRRLLISCGYENAEAFVITTGILASLTDETGATVTTIRRISRRSYNIDKIIRVNDISRGFADGTITAEQAVKKMEEIRDTPQAFSFTKIFASGIACACFTYMFGGSFPNCLNAFFTGFILQVLLIQLRKIKVSDVLVNVVGGSLISFLTLTFLNLGIGSNLDNIIIGSLMPMLPGMTMINAIRDILEGDYLSGAARVMDAFIVALALACGVGTMLKLWFHLFGGVMI